MLLTLQNPHSVLAALQTRPRDVVEIRLATSRTSGAWAEVAELAARNGVTVMTGEARRTGRRRPKNAGAGGQAGRTGAGEARVKERAPLPVAEVLANPGSDHPDSASDSGGLWLALDQLQDPHNVGAIFRTAAFFGVRGIILTRDRSAPVNATVYDVASGGLEYVPFAAPSNLSRVLDTAREQGLWILGTSEHSETDLAEIDRDRPWLLVVGNEEKGLRRLTAEKCDQMCRLTPRTPVTSLNVSVATGIAVAALGAGLR